MMPSDERRAGRQEGAVGCVGDDELAAYVAGLLEGVTLEGVREHVGRCEDCALLVAAAAEVGSSPSDGSGGASAAGPGRVGGAASQQDVGRYELLELIGRGAMGSVYRARDRQTGGTVAIKRLEHAGAKPVGSELARFLRESALLRRLAHPNIVRVLETIDSGDSHQIVMEYLPGGSLRQWLDARRRLSIEQALPVLVELSDALARAHYLGVVHRDVKPANVLLAADGTLRLVDFGLARLAAEPLTTSLGLFGTVPYMSPEGLSGAPVDEKADVWALGVTLFEITSGVRPFRGPSPAAIMAAIVGAPVPALALGTDPVSLALERLVMRMLDRDRGARPSAREVGAIAEALRTGQPAMGGAVAPARVSVEGSGPPRSAALSPLPLSPTPFLGRSAELSSVRRMLADEGVRWVTIVAPGGMGKSRLAIEVARSLQVEGSRRAVCFIDLTLLDDPDLMASTIAAGLSLGFAPDGDLRKHLIGYLRDKELLLLMDNFEHVAAAAPFVVDLLSHAPAVKVLATSREALRVQAEHKFALAGMHLHEPGAVAAGGGSDALDLFVSSAHRVDVNFDPEADAGAVHQVCRLVQGSPLGIMLAASWVNVLSAREIADEIAKNLDFLSADLRDVPGRQRSLRAVFEHSFELLSEPERQSFASLSVFRGGFTRAAAEAMGFATAQQLAALAAKSFLSWQPSSGRYHVHELLRQYGEEALRAVAGRHEQAMEHFTSFFVHFLTERKGVLEGPNPLRAVREIEGEFGNVREACSWAASLHQLERIESVMWIVWLFHYRRGSRDEADRTTVNLIEAFTPFERWGPSGSRIGALALTLRALVAESQGRVADTIDFLERSTALGEGAGDCREHALALLASGWCLGKVRGSERCIADAERGLAMYRRTGSEWDVAFGLMLLARAYQRTANDNAQAEALLRESLALQRSAYGAVVIPGCLNRLASLHGSRGDWQDARHWAQEGLDTAERLGDVWTLQDSLQLAATAQLNVGDVDSAEASARRCIELSRGCGGLLSATWSFVLLGNILRLQGRAGEARAQYEQARGLSTSRTAASAAAEMNLAELAAQEGRSREAERDLAQCLRTFEDCRSESGVVAACCSLGHLLCDEGRGEEARPFFERALSLCRASRQPRHTLEALAGAAAWCAQASDDRLAAELCSLLQHLPTLDYAVRARRVAPLLGELERRMPATEYTSALERGKQLNPDHQLERLSARLAAGAGARA